MPATDALKSGAGAAAVTPHDTTKIAVTRGLYCGVSGDVKVDMLNGDTVTFTNLADGIIHPLQVDHVYSTGTTATNIVAIY